MKPISKPELTILLSALFLVAAIPDCGGTAFSSMVSTVRTAAPVNANTGALKAEPTTQPAEISTGFSTPLATPTSVYTYAMASQWVEYWDRRYGYGLAIPCHWTIYSTPLEGQAATLSMTSYDEAFIRAQTDKGVWKNNQPVEGALKIDLTVFERIAPDASLEDVVRQELTNEFATVESVQEKALGLRQVVLAILVRRVDASDKNQVIAFRISPDKVLIMSVLPASAWESSDVQGVLHSFAFSHQEKIVMPSTAPATVLAPVPNWCVDK